MFLYDRAYAIAKFLEDFPEGKAARILRNFTETDNSNNEISENQEQLADRVGTTTDFSEASFILQDGRLLKEGPQRLLTEVTGKPNYLEAIFTIMEGHGAIHFHHSPTTALIPYPTKISQIQFSTILQLAQESENVILKVTGPDGRVSSVVHDQDTIKSLPDDIEEFYQSGTLPDPNTNNPHDYMEIAKKEVFTKVVGGNNIEEFSDLSTLLTSGGNSVIRMIAGREGISSQVAINLSSPEVLSLALHILAANGHDKVYHFLDLLWKNHGGTPAPERPRDLIGEFSKSLKIIKTVSNALQKSGKRDTALAFAIDLLTHKIDLEPIATRMNDYILKNIDRITQKHRREGVDDEGALSLKQEKLKSALEMIREGKVKNKRGSGTEKRRSIAELARRG